MTTALKEIHIEKGQPEPDDLVIVLGGPSMLIGLGGGSASSVKGGSSSSDLDFASVQRSNPEMQRRAQQVLDKFNERSSKNPITFIHDVGAADPVVPADSSSSAPAALLAEVFSNQEQRRRGQAGVVHSDPGRATSFSI